MLYGNVMTLPILLTSIIIYTQGYYSILLYIFIDLNINFVSMTVADCIDFIAFFAFRCNGTTVLAEIHRVIIEDPEKYSTSHANLRSQVLRAILVLDELFIVLVLSMVLLF